jgi:hypothetical protein
MSYITPYKYRNIAESIATAYAAVRSSLSTTANTQASSIVTSVLDYPDDNVDGLSHSTTIDPIGSISNDLGTTVFQFGPKFNSTNAIGLAAAFFTPILQSINSHVLRRTGASATNMVTYMTTYALTSGSAEMSLFSANGSTVNSSYYFSQDFTELCAQINITIPSNFVHA